MKLDQAEEGKSYKIEKIDDKRMVKLKLISMGIYPSVIFKMIRNDDFGPVILAIDTHRISLGRGIVSNIEVSEI